MMPVADQALKQIIRESGVRDGEFLTGLIESISGKKVEDSVWSRWSGEPCVSRV